MIAVGASSIQHFLREHALRELFVDELGWDHVASEFELSFDAELFRFSALASKRGFMVLSCHVHRTVVANRGLLRQLQRLLTRRYHEHIVVFYSDEPAKQVWQWSTIREDGKRLRHREHPFFSAEPPPALLSRLELLRFTLDEEESATIVDAISRVRTALDVDSEQELFARYPNFSRQSDSLAVRMRAGDKDALDEFILFHRKLAKRASRMLIRWVGLDADDAEQIAMLGVIEAAKRFDPAKGYQFSTYASYWIRQQCQRYGVNDGLMIRFPGYIFWPAYKFEFEHGRLLATYGNELPDEMLESQLDDYGIAREHWETYSLAKEALAFSDLDHEQFEQLRSIKSTDESILDRLVEDEMIQAVLGEMVDLRERDCQIIGARYGLVHAEMTLQECAVVLGVTRERVRQIQARGEEELRNALRFNFPDFFEDDACSHPISLEDEADEPASDTIKAKTWDAAVERISTQMRVSQHEPIKPPQTNERDEKHQRECEPMSQWIFAELSGAAVRRDPQETELFKTEDAGENEYAGTDALVREVIQNSMDAGTDDGPVRLRFGLHPQHKLPSKEVLAIYFGRLEPALRHRDVDYDSDGVPLLDFGFLVCEDFGTCGLGGDVALAKDPPPGHCRREDFFWFWRNIGRSGKTGDDLGRWGLGKTVYRAASRVGCMLGLTIRAEDRQRYLMGQAVLRLHEHEGVEYAPEGFWCGGTRDDGLPIPISDSSHIDQFVSDWGLTRTTEPGLSVVVPYVTDALRAESILRLVAINFFVPILKGDLIVDIAGPGLPGGKSEVRVDASSIDSVCSLLEWRGRVTYKQSCPPPLSLVRSSLAADEKIVPTRLLGTSGIPAIDDESFAPDDKDKLRRMFKDGELVAIRVRIALPLKAGGHDEGEMLVYLERQSGTERFESYYVREGMTITRLNSKRSLRGIKAWAMVEPGPLASLLGDTEGPSHISWDTSNDERPNRKWKTWKGRVKFASKVIDALAEYLTPATEEADFDLLSDFFSIENVSSPKPGRRPNEKGKSDRPITPPAPTPRWYRSAPKPSGFRVTSSSALPVPENAVLRISVAYDMAGGNPLRHWSRFDFDFRAKDQKQISFKGKGIAATLRSGNVIDIKITDTEFELTATGFDVHRDLFIRIDEVSDDEGEAT